MKARERDEGDDALSSGFLAFSNASSKQPCHMKTKCLFPIVASIALPVGAQLPEDVHLELLPIEMELDSMLHISTMFRPYDPEIDPDPGRLTEDDYKEVAEELGVEVAAIKAVVDIETGRTHIGFWAPGKPLINFDLSIYRSIAPRHGVNLAEARRRHPEIFNKPNVRKYGSQQAAQQARLDAAMSIDKASALESVFWGMFQIGGFNWKKCGTSSVYEFVELMSRSERDQLELFAAFCMNNNLVKYIKNKNWAAFSLRYNGPGYKKLGYDTKMAAAYQKFKRESD